MSGTSKGGEKAAESRGRESLAEAGRKGGQSADHQKAAAHQDMSAKGREGGKQSSSGGRKSDQDR